MYVLSLHTPRSLVLTASWQSPTSKTSAYQGIDSWNKDGLKWPTGGVRHFPVLENKLNGDSVIHSEHRHVTTYPAPLLFSQSVLPLPTLHIHGKDISASGKEVEVTKHLLWAMELHSSAMSSAFRLEGTRSVISGAGGWYHIPTCYKENVSRGSKV